MKMQKTNYFKTFAIGAISSLSLPPLFLFSFWILGICYLMNKINTSNNIQSVFKSIYLWGFGHFATSLYWIIGGPATYYEDFWWAIPFALFGLPLILAFFLASISTLTWYLRKSKFFSLSFTFIWTFFEWIKEWIFTGFPWNSVNYILHFSDVLIQTSAIWGTYGQIFITMFISTSIYDLYYKRNRITFFLSYIIIISISIYGYISLQEKTTYSKTYVRLVQPSTIQHDKWNYQLFIDELDKLIELSNLPSENPIDLVIWPEAAVILPTKYQKILDKISSAADINKILITGGEIEEDNKLYTSIYALNHKAEIISFAHKHHLVPFGEYIPLRRFFPWVKKITPGLMDFTPGKVGTLLKVKELNIYPFICYEALFPSEIPKNHKADFFIHITNDSYYGNTSGPYQHLEQSRARAIENNIPLLRVGSNGISAIIDNKGRILEQIPLNHIGIIDSFIPTYN